MLKRICFFAVLAALLTLGSTWAAKSWKEKHLEGPKAPQALSVHALKNAVASSKSPDSLNLDLPFYTQAPHGNWDYPWQEACEEASVLLVANHYLDLKLNAEQFNQGLLDLVDWQMDTWGAYEHSSVEQTAQMLESNYGLKSVVHVEPTFETLQAILNRGNLIIAPFAGKELKNPNFKNGGPVYHMLVIKGYDAQKKQVVTHDVGTRNGADYVYNWSTIQNALHDWHNDDIMLGTAQWLEVLR